MRMLAQPRGRATAIVGVMLVLATAGCAGSQAGRGPDTSAQSPDYYRMGRKSEAAGNYDAAATFYRKAASIQESPAAERFIDLGRTLFKAERFQQARDAYTRALDHDSENFRALYGLGRIGLARDRPEAALDAFEAALEARARPPAKTYIGKGVALDLAGRHDAAQQTYRAGLDRFSESVPLANNLGLSLALSGEARQAVDVLEPLAQGPAASPKVRDNLALAYALDGDMTAARRVASYDLAPARVRDNMAYYDAARAMLAGSLADD